MYFRFGSRISSSFRGLFRHSNFAVSKTKRLEFSSFHDYFTDDEKSSPHPLIPQRYFLFKDSFSSSDSVKGDHLLNELALAETVEDVFIKFGSKPADSVSSKVAAQALATLFHLQKSYGTVMSMNNGLVSTNYTLYKKFNVALQSDPRFHEVIKSFGIGMLELPWSVRALVFLCLARLGLNLEHEVMRNILVHFRKNPYSIDLEALSYLSVGIRYSIIANQYQFIGGRSKLSWYLYLSPALPRFIELLSRTNSLDELKKVSIILFSFRDGLSDSVLKEYFEKTHRIIGDLPPITTGSVANDVVKIISSASLSLGQNNSNLSIHRAYHDAVTQGIRRLQSKVYLLTWIRAVQLSALSNKFYSNPALKSELFRSLYDIVENKTEGAFHENRLIHELCRLSEYKLSKKEWEDVVIPFLRDDLDEADFCFHALSVITMAFHSDIKRGTSSTFHRFLDRIIRTRSPEFIGSIMHLYNWQKRFDHSMKNSEEIFRFESRAKNILEKGALETRLTHQFGEYFSLALVASGSESLQNELLERFESFLPRFTLLILYRMSLNVDTAVKENPQNLQARFIKKVLSEKLKHLLVSGKFNLLPEDILSVCKRLLLKNDQNSSRLNDIIADLYDEVTRFPLTNNRISFLSDFRNSWSSLPELKPEVAESWMMFLMQNSNDLGVSYSLVKCFHSENVSISSEFIKYFNEVLFSSVYSKTVEVVLRSALIALARGFISEEVVKAIFSIKFMDKIDSELNSDYFRTMEDYSLRTRSLLMQLNRGIYLLRPQYGVPWFHSKFCAEQNRNPQKPNPIKDYESVYSALLEVVDDNPDNIKEFVRTPYSHVIPFEIGKKCNSTFGSFNVSDPLRVGESRLAIFPEKFFQFKSDFELIRRELEVLGYTVHWIDSAFWNSMKMSSHRSRVNYFKSLLEIPN